jgi:transposase-like protein
MTYRLNLPENADVWELQPADPFDQARIDPARAQAFLKARLRQEAKAMLENILLTEAEEQLAAVEYERAPGVRLDVRNGYRTRSLLGSFGLIELQVPRARHLSLSFSVFEAYRRRWREVDALLLEAYVGGMGSRSVGRRLAAMLGAGCSATTVTRLASALDERLGSFHTQPLQDRYTALIMDGMYLRIRGLGTTKRPLVAVLGITPEGQTELIALRLCYSENSVEVEGLLRSLRQRGLTGSRLQLVALDGDKGLESAVLNVWGHVRIQDCIFHRIHRLKANARNRFRARTMMKEASAAFANPQSHRRRDELEAFCGRWKNQEPKAIRCFAHQLHRCFEVDALPAALRSLLTTTSVLEGLFSQLRKRLNPIGALQSPRAAERFALAGVMRMTWISLPGMKPDQPLLETTHKC